ncbi:outer membrane beta-barrel protein [Galbibacter mesophilus]|uniref:outer membrane beta-barrel protein n=1 Tax=Galbibacter mesophilus TaxID=379069 RepID=UPI00191FC25D|nr:outer membrane beta-barrel protein [Galbibacter mesophilus]MCM5663216.1 PorT family protein [Galbibacter mesophilus]
MNKYIKYVIVSISFLLGHTTINAQQSKKELSIHLGSTINLISHGISNEDTKSKYGNIVGLSYSFYFNDNWSIGIGVDYQSYRSSIALESIEDSYNTIDFDGDLFEFRYTANNYNESLKIENLNFPLTVQYETSGTRTRFYALAGIKAGFVLNSSYQTNITSIKTSGYYAQYNAILNDPEFIGFGTFNDINTSEEDLNTGMAWFTTLEAGIKHYLNNKNAVYIGIFFDSGLNSIIDQEQQQQEVVTYPTDEYPVVLEYNSITQSKFSEKIRFSTFGLKIRFAFLNK